MQKFFKSRHWKVFLVTASIIAAILALSLLGQVFLLLAMSFVLTMVLKPVVDYLEKRGIPRPGGILIMYVLIGGIVVFTFITVYPIVVVQLSSLSTLMTSEHLTLMLNQTAASISERIPFVKAAVIAERLRTLLPEAAKAAEDSLTSALGLVASLIIVPFITFFLLNDYYKMQKALIENVPNKYFEMALNVVHTLDSQISKYIRGVCIDSIAVALLYAIAYQAIGVQYATVLGLIGGITNIIPLAGPVIGALPVMMVSIIQYGDFRMIIPIAIVTIAVRQLDDIFVQPNLYGKLLNMRSVNDHDRHSSWRRVDGNHGNGRGNTDLHRHHRNCPRNKLGVKELPDHRKPWIISFQAGTGRSSSSHSQSQRRSAFSRCSARSFSCSSSPLPSQ